MSVLIPYPREMHILWSHCETEEDQKIKNNRKLILAINTVLYVFIFARGLGGWSNFVFGEAGLSR